ncbi:ATP-binding protein [Desulforhopalus sp. IMCC35007]|uniref:ATP-binding protein n=1 Tax=Desulforhopalus sp. IMCC35007 TaxID=2569543 RepID=UPI0010AECA46|nr:ATP-binding protein [Desulforhopalus sp. IMCC35007]TKB06447.1 ATP-binding protein [Desulforhopalus sp. IMCC35007]
MNHIFKILKDQDGLTTLSKHLAIISKEWKMTKKDVLQLNLVLDELITNIIEHGGGCKKCPIEVSMQKTACQIRVQLTDGGPPFDPTQCKSADTTTPVESRKCGGLGILFVHKFSDNCSYNRTDGKNVFHFTKTYKESAEN